MGLRDSGSSKILQDDGHEEIAQIIRSLNKYGCKSDVLSLSSKQMLSLTA
jgi:hypothetical protein